MKRRRKKSTRKKKNDKKQTSAWKWQTMLASTEADSPKLSTLCAQRLQSFIGLLFSSQQFNFNAHQLFIIALYIFTHFQFYCFNS